MKRLLFASLVSLAALGLTAGPSLAGLLPFHCCCHNKCSMYFCCKQWNAFDCMCFGNLCCSGCCMPFGNGGNGCCNQGCCPDACDGGSCGQPGSCCSTGCCEGGSLPAPGGPAAALPPAPDGSHAGVPQPLTPVPPGATPTVPTAAPSVSYYGPAAYSPVQAVGYENPYAPYAGYASNPYAMPMPRYAPASTPMVPSYWYGGRQGY
jgi:hypothetical protein